MADVPGFGCRKLSSTTWSATSPIATRATATSLRAAFAIRAHGLAGDSLLRVMLVMVFSLLSIEKGTPRPRCCETGARWRVELVRGGSGGGVGGRAPRPPPWAAPP